MNNIPPGNRNFVSLSTILKSSEVYPSAFNTSHEGEKARDKLWPATHIVDIRLLIHDQMGQDSRDHPSLTQYELYLLCQRWEWLQNEQLNYHQTISATNEQ